MILAKARCGACGARIPLGAGCSPVVFSLPPYEVVCGGCQAAIKTTFGYRADWTSYFIWKFIMTFSVVGFTAFTIYDKWGSDLPAVVPFAVGIFGGAMLGGVGGFVIALALAYPAQMLLEALNAALGGKLDGRAIGFTGARAATFGWGFIFSMLSLLALVSSLAGRSPDAVETSWKLLLNNEVVTLSESELIDRIRRNEIMESSLVFDGAEWILLGEYPQGADILRQARSAAPVPATTSGNRMLAPASPPASADVRWFVLTSDGKEQGPYSARVFWENAVQPDRLKVRREGTETWTTPFEDALLIEAR